MTVSAYPCAMAAMLLELLFLSFSSCLPVRVAVQTRRRAVGSPAGVCNAGVGVEDLVHIKVGLVHQLPQLGHLADLLEGKDLILLVAIDGKSSRIIATVLETGQTCRRGREIPSQPRNWTQCARQSLRWEYGIDSLIVGGEEEWVQG